MAPTWLSAARPSCRYRGSRSTRAGRCSSGSGSRVVRRSGSSRQSFECGGAARRTRRNTGRLAGMSAARPARPAGARRCWTRSPPRWPSTAPRCSSRRPAPARPRWSRWPWPPTRRRGGCWSPSRDGWPPGRPRPGWPRCWVNRSAGPSGTRCAARRDAARAPGSRWSPRGCCCAGWSADPELAGVGCVLLDECHERHLDADLLLALLLDARDGLRPDLRLLATSATVATGRLAELLGAGRPRCSPCRRGLSRRGRRARTAGARGADRGVRGPGGAARAGRGRRRRAGVPARGRRRSGARRRRWPTSDAGCCRCTGLPAADQDAALRPRSARRRRVVLATAVAESSLTVPGVRAVVDAGLARVPRVDHRRGLAGLVTVRGVGGGRRAAGGPGGPGGTGTGVPLLARGTSMLARYPEPEIRTADLTRLALDLACWGTPDGTRPALVGPPAGRPAARRAAGAARARRARRGRRATERGRRMAGLGPAPSAGPGTARRGPARRRAHRGRGGGAARRRHARRGAEVDGELRRLRSGAGAGSRALARRGDTPGPTAARREPR